MKKLMLFAAIAGLGLAAAAPPQGSGPGAGWALGAQGGYPACSKTVTDRCIQLYERGVATRQNLALNDRLGKDTRLASAPARAWAPESSYTPAPASVGGPYEPLPYRTGSIVRAPAAPADYPACSRLITDSCIQRHRGR
jgi:hypothetical protein